MAIINQWGVTYTDFAGVVHTDAVHRGPVYSLRGDFDTNTGRFVGQIWKSDTGGGYFGVSPSHAAGSGGSLHSGDAVFKLVFVLKRSDDSTVNKLLATYRGSEHTGSNGRWGQTPLDIDTTIDISGFVSANLYMTCSHTSCEAASGRIDPPIDPMVGTPILLNQNNFDIQLTQPPTLDSISNRSPYNSNNAISNYETSIDLNYSYSGDSITGMDIQLNNAGYGSFTYNDGNKTITITGLTAGTTYNVKVRVTNSAGDSGWKEITIRTRHSKPSISVSHDHASHSGLEDVTITWSSDSYIQSVEYTIDGSGWITGASGLNARSGSITITQKSGADLYPSTTYAISVRLLSTSGYDSLYSDSSSLSCTTDAIASLLDSSPRSFNIGDSLRIIKSNESGNTNQIRLMITTSDIAWKTQNSPSNDYYISFTQAEWDSAYRQFISPANPSISTAEHNRVRLKIRLVTLGRSREYTLDYTGYLNLTGVMLTAHTNVGGTVRRGQVWCNPDGSGPRRAVTWISTAQGTWRRGI